MGNIQATLKASFPPASRYSEKNIPSQEGKTIIVTGGNTGIGYETCRVLLSKGAKVILAARSEEKARKAISDLKASTGKDSIEWLKLDLADLKQVQSAAAEFQQREKQLHALFLNAGVMVPPAGSKTAQGIEMQFGVNVLGSHAFGVALLPVLRETARTTPKGTVRLVVTASSAAQHLSPSAGVELEKVETEKYINQGGFGLYTKYGASKFGNVLFANEFARRYGNEGIVAVSLDPGNIDSDLWRHQGLFKKTLGRLILHPVSLGAITQLYGGTSPDVTPEDGGCFLEPWARKSALRHPRAKDEELAKAQWEWCEKKIAQSK